MQQGIPNPSKNIKCTNSFPIQKKKRWQQVLPCQHEAYSREAADHPSTSSQGSSSD